VPALKWLPEALADLDRLFLFLKERNPSAASRAARAVRRSADRLASLPEIGRPMADGSGRRELVIPFAGSGYVLRYRIDADGSVVVIRVWHGRENRRR
jgi:plasmid stabilization system protein ParE